MSHLFLIEAYSPTELVPEGYGWALLKMLGALILVCTLAYLVLRWLRIYLASSRMQGGHLRVIDRCSLSAKQNLWIVQAGGRFFLLASNEGPGGGVTKLAEFDQEPTPQDERLSSSSFWQVLKKKR